MNPVHILIALSAWSALLIYLTRVSTNRAWRRFISKDGSETIAPDGKTFSGDSVPAKGFMWIFTGRD